MPIATIPTRAFTEQNLSFKNIIINGDMSIAQRGTSTASVTATGYNACDRWKNVLNTLGTFTVSQDTDVPTGQGFAKSLKMDCTTADAAPAAGDFNAIIQAVEGQNLQYLKKGTSSAESLTLSFWVKSNKTGTYTCEFRDVDNTRSISQTYTISSASTWEKKTITIDGDTTGAFDNDNAASFQMFFWLGAGTNYTDGTLNTSWNASTSNQRVSSSNVNLADNTANNFWITGVQLEAGTTASDFEFLPRAITESLCQRYFYIVTEVGIPGFLRADDTVFRDFYMPYKVTMRANPTITATTNFGTFSNTYPSTRQMWGRVTISDDTSSIFMQDDITFDAEL